MVNGDYKFVCVRACVCFVFVVLLLLLLLVFSGLLLVSCGSFVFDTVVYYRLITAYGPVSLSPFSHAGSGLYAQRHLIAMQIRYIGFKYD